MRRVALTGPANPHATEQMVPANELVIECRADVQENESCQERPARSVDDLPSETGAVESLRDAADTE